MKSNFHFIFVLLFCFFFISCTSTINHVSYSFIDYGNTYEKDILGLPRNQFINYDDYIFEFVLQKNIVTNITQGEKNTSITTASIDTIGVLVHNLSSKTYTKIWPFDTTFKIIEKNKSISEKKEGFVVSFKGKSDPKFFETHPIYKWKVIDGLKSMYFEIEDSVFQSRGFFINKTHFKSPYELYTDLTNFKYSMIGYKINHKKSSDSFGEIIANIKPIDATIKTKCRLIISKLNS